MDKTGIPIRCAIWTNFPRRGPLVLSTFLKPKIANKTYQSRLSRQIDILKPFHLDIEHVPRSNSDLAD